MKKILFNSKDQVIDFEIFLMGIDRHDNYTANYNDFTISKAFNGVELTKAVEMGGRVIENELIKS